MIWVARERMIMIEVMAKKVFSQVDLVLKTRKMKAGRRGKRKVMRERGLPRGEKVLFCSQTMEEKALRSED